MAETATRLNIRAKIKTEEIIIGGGYVNGPFSGIKKGIGYTCWSWGLATCIESQNYFQKRAELKCPDEYEKKITGFYVPNPSSSENIDIFFICIKETLSKINNSLTILLSVH